MYRTLEEALSAFERWSGKNVLELYEAARYIRSLGEFDADLLLLHAEHRTCTRSAVPHSLEKYLDLPIWAVDSSGYAFVGNPGQESILRLSDLVAAARSRGFDLTWG